MERRHTDTSSAGLLLIAASCLSLAAGGSSAADQKRRMPTAISTGKQKELISVNQPDLVATHLSARSDGRVQYELMNRSAQGTSEPFAVDIYIGAARRDTIVHSGLHGRERLKKTSSLAKIESCQGVPVRLVVDMQDLVRETNENNNERRATLAKAPCPDPVVPRSPKSGRLGIHAEPVSGSFQFRLQITIRNDGSTASPPVVVEVVSGKRGGKLRKERHTIPGLRVGEITDFITGPWRRNPWNWVADIRIDPEDRISELSEDNNHIRWSN